VLAICTKLIVLILTLVAGIWAIATLGEQMLWLAVFADVGVVMLAVLNALRIFRMKDNIVN
jgi:cation transport ATPase